MTKIKPGPLYEAEVAEPPAVQDTEKITRSTTDLLNKFRLGAQSQGQDKSDRGWAVVVHNSEYCADMAMAAAFVRVLKIDEQQALALAMKVHRDGKCKVASGLIKAKAEKMVGELKDAARTEDMFMGVKINDLIEAMGFDPDTYRNLHAVAEPEEDKKA